MRDLDLPRGDERELVVDRDRVYELDGEDSRTLAAVGAFRVVPEHDLDLPHDTLENLHDQRLVELVDLGDSERGSPHEPADVKATLCFSHRAALHQGPRNQRQNRLTLTV